MFGAFLEQGERGGASQFPTLDGTHVTGREAEELAKATFVKAAIRTIDSSSSVRVAAPRQWRRRRPEPPPAPLPPTAIGAAAAVPWATNGWRRRRYRHRHRQRHRHWYWQQHFE